MDSTFFIKAVQLILAFGLLVIVHEFGHYIFREFSVSEWRNSIYSLTLGSACLNISLKRNRERKTRLLGATRSMVSAGFRLADIVKFRV